MGLNIDSIFSQDLCFWIHGSSKKGFTAIFFKVFLVFFFFIKISLYFKYSMYFFLSFLHIFFLKKFYTYFFLKFSWYKFQKGFFCINLAIPKRDCFDFKQPNMLCAISDHCLNSQLYIMEIRY